MKNPSSTVHTSILKPAALWLLAAGAFLTGLAELIIAGILDYISASLQVTEGTAGQLITAYSLSFAICTPILIMLTSRLPRKQVLLATLVVFLAASALTLFAISFAAVLIARILLGASAGVYLVVAFGYIGRLAPPSQMGRAAGTIALAFSASMVLGVPLGIAAAEYWSWQSIFIGLAAGTILIMAALAGLLPRLDGEQPVPLLKQLAVLSDRSILALLLYVLFINFSFSFFYSYINPYLGQILHLGPAGIASAMLGLGIVGMIGSRLGGWLADSLGSSKTLLYAAGAQAVLMLLLSAASGFAAASLPLLGLWICSMFMSAPALQTFINQNAGSAASLVQSLNMSFTHAGIAAGAGAGGWMLASVGTPAYHPLLAAAAAALAVAAYFASRKAARAGRQATATRNA